MNPMKSLQLAGVLALASLIHVSSITAQDEVTALDPEEGVLEPASDAKPLGVTTEHLAFFSRRLADAEALEDLNASIAEIHKLIQDLKEERKGWLVERERIFNAAAAVERKIEDVKDDIDDIEDAIVAASIATAGIASPELVAIRQGLIVKKNRLKAQREGLKNDFRVAGQKIGLIDDLLKVAEKKLWEKQAEKTDLQKQIAKVSLTAPSEGARLLVDSSEELRISSDKPPKTVRIEVQKMVYRTVVIGGTADEARVDNLERLAGKLMIDDPPGDPGRDDTIGENWEAIYDRILEWKNLESAGPGAVTLAFKTGVKPERRSIPIIGLEAFWLDRGEYRVRVLRMAESEHNNAGAAGHGAYIDGLDDWKRFSVVGKLDSEALEKRVPAQAGDPKIKFGSKQVKPGAVLRPTGAKDDDDEDDSE